MVVHGNLLKEEAISISEKVYELLKKPQGLTEERFPEDRITVLPEGKTVLVRESLPNRVSAFPSSCIFLSLFLYFVLLITLSSRTTTTPRFISMLK
jgi:hypothetical protein